ncbi:uncharacterized protein A4U43_C04F4860 [Asparagus officinalis]|uniref:Uncharacterized protein n=1 Tax=Asparagus officinalis TaxID=4686 RepID=A0A5P1EZ09_ASPOF|nr:uncharacterized protein A4U43_C04F4860 [Asparagus officinalis]
MVNAMKQGQKARASLIITANIVKAIKGNPFIHRYHNWDQWLGFSPFNSQFILSKSKMERDDCKENQRQHLLLQQLKSTDKYLAERTKIFPRRAREGNHQF